MATTEPDPEPQAPPLPLEERVHGVGGPQAVKMLGEVREEDVVTVPAFLLDDAKPPCRVPSDARTRFAQRIRGSRTEAYEWGGLISASSAKALWILYLPFTLVNAAGWAHAANRTTESDGEDARATTPGPPWCLRMHLALTHVVAVLATLTYVAWISYITMELIARDWVDYVCEQVGLEEHSLTYDLVVVWTPRVAPALGVLLSVALFLSPVPNGRWESTGATAGERDARWPRVPTVAGRGFFAHDRSHRVRLKLHGAIGGAAVVAALLQYMIGWNRLGIVLLVLAAVQVVVLALLCVFDVVGRWNRRPREVFHELVEDPHVDDAGARAPAGAAFAVLGTALAHSAFAGLALTLAPLLARWPQGEDGRRKGTQDSLDLGAELLAGDVLGWVIVLLGVAAIVVLFTTRPDPLEENVAGTAGQGFVVRIARHVPRLVTFALVAVVLPVAVYILLNVRGVLDVEPVGSESCSGVLDRLDCWYDQYESNEDAVAKRIGSFVLLALPGVAYGSLRRNHEKGVGRVVGNVWDVLTFWPRRFHPYAAPCSAERAVPELRGRLEHVARNLPPDERDGVVVVAHSQGSVLSVAAISSMRPELAAPSLVSFGSPLGTLYLPTWPAYLPPLLVAAEERAKGPRGGWVNFWRQTDPIGAQVPAAENRHLPEPQDAGIGDLDAIGRMAPLERPNRWGTVVGHNRYLSETTVQDAIRDRRADGPAPRRRRSARRSTR